VSNASSGRTDLRGPLLAACALLILHVILAKWLDPGTNVAVACTNFFALWQYIEVNRLWKGRRTLAYVAGYMVLFVLFVAIAKSPLLFAGFGLLYAGCFRVPFLLGYLGILIFSVAAITPYYIQASILLGLLYTIVANIYPKRLARFQLLCFGIGFILVISVMLPLLYLCFQVTPQTLMVNAKDTQFGHALLTSILTASISTGIILLFGVPLAYALARLDFWGKGFVDSLIDLPIVIPQSVAGIALLVFLGPKTPVGQFVENTLGVEIAGSTLGIIVCQVFVSSPFLVRSATNAFRDMGPALENVSRTLGASPLNTFFRISLPMASGAIFSGCILTWARAISEVGSLMVLAYHPFTVSIYTYDMFVQYGLQEARPAAVLLVIVCLWGFLALRWLRGISLGPLFRTASGTAS
jgi:molybdate/tungstate transport system permease protein